MYVSKRSTWQRVEKPERAGCSCRPRQQNVSLSSVWPLSLEMSRWEWARWAFHTLLPFWLHALLWAHCEHSVSTLSACARLSKRAVNLSIAFTAMFPSCIFAQVKKSFSLQYTGTCTSQQPTASSAKIDTSVSAISPNSEIHNSSHFPVIWLKCLAKVHGKDS